MNRIQAKLEEDKKLLSIYFSAGFPEVNDTVEIIKRLEKSGVDMIEIGLPFKDSLMYLKEKLLETNTTSFFLRIDPKPLEATLLLP